MNNIGAYDLLGLSEQMWFRQQLVDNGHLWVQPINVSDNSTWEWGEIANGLELKLLRTLVLDSGSMKRLKSGEVIEFDFGRLKWKPIE